MITFRCFHCGEEMEISRKMAGKRVQCVECGVIIDVPRPGGRREYNAEEKEFLRSVTEKADREEHEKERRDDENQPSIPIARGRCRGKDVGMTGGILLMLVGAVWP